MYYYSDIAQFRNDSPLMNEEWIIVEVWNEQVGAWSTVDEAKDDNDAARIIRDKLNDYDTCDSTYSIVHHKREVFKRGL